jgi:hypothetical protein
MKISVEVIRLNLSIKKPLKNPKIKIDFLGKVDVNLDTGCSYTDGINIFIAISKNEIILGSDFVDTFEIPKEIICIHKPYCQTS